jgi:hypothetical protein
MLDVLDGLTQHCYSGTHPRTVGMGRACSPIHLQVVWKPIPAAMVKKHPPPWPPHGRRTATWLGGRLAWHGGNGGDGHLHNEEVEQSPIGGMEDRCEVQQHPMRSCGWI